MNIIQETLIHKTIDFVKEVLSDAEVGHDWWQYLSCLEII